jgi:hypothetical protein
MKKNLNLQIKPKQYAIFIFLNKYPFNFSPSLVFNHVIYAGRIGWKKRRKYK